ncbi:MAG: 30S ribosomal protein S15 [Candidatus Woesearchaeota archaeon]
MARMHARTRGKAKSQRPTGRPLPNKSPDEKTITKLITELAKNNSPSQVGNLLRDEHGVLDVKASTGKKLTEIYNEVAKPLELPEDLRNLVRKAVILRKHIETNQQDRSAKRGLGLTESKVQRLRKHHVATGKVPRTWKYDPKQYSYLAE